VRTITSAISTNEFAHSYLFAGPRGTGKTTLARLIAKSLNCENRKEGDFEPCCKCNLCGEVARGVALDIIEIDAASNRGIDEIRQLKEGIRFAPTYGKYKIFIIDEVHMLTKEAFNALLKTLEEPPLHAVFVLATTEINKVLPTIISRSQRFDFRRLRHGEIRDRLALLIKNEKKKLDMGVLDLIAARADGSARDAESMLGQILAVADGLSLDEIRSLFGFADLQAVSKFINYIADRNKKDAVAFISKMCDKGVDLEEFIKSAMGYIRWMMFLKVDSGLEDLIAREMSKENLEELKQTAQKFEMPHLQKAVRLFQEASVNFKYSPIPELPIEMAVVELSSTEVELSSTEPS